MSHHLPQSLFFLTLTGLLLNSPIAQAIEPENPIGNITSVTQLSDVQPTDWAFRALQSLVERYGCIAGYGDATFWGNRAMSRYEFAAGMSACLDRVQELISAGTSDWASQADLEKLRKLQSEFATELQTLKGRIDRLDGKTSTLEKQQFSTTTKLVGQVIIAANAGGFTGDRIIGLDGRTIATEDPNATIIQRTALFLNTSFTGKDLLQVLLDVGSGGDRDNATAVLEPIFGSGLDYSSKPPSNGQLALGRLVYTFSPSPTLSVSIGPNIRTTDFIDRNRYANRSFFDFSTQAFVNNFSLLPIYGTSSGAAIEWKPSQQITLRSVYAASSAEIPGRQTNPLRGVGLITRSFYANPQGQGGLFGSTYQGAIELEYKPNTNTTIRAEYTGGKLYNNRFNAIGLNAEFALSQQFGLFGRYSRANYDDTRYGDLNPQSWMAGISVSDLGKPGAILGLAFGQPVVESHLGNSTQTNWEIFYNYPVNQHLRITPTLQVVSNASNQSSNDRIFAGTVRMVFGF